MNVPSSGQNFEAVAREIEIANDFGPQERNDVGENREFEAGNDLFGDRRAAQHVALFEHQHLAPGARQIGRVHQAVVPAADNDYIVRRSHAMSADASEAGQRSETKRRARGADILQAAEVQRTRKNAARPDLRSGASVAVKFPISAFIRT